MSVLRKKLRSRRGMSFTELLMAVAIMGILFSAIVTAMNSAAKVYRQSVAVSDAQTLGVNVVNALENELRYARNIKSEGGTWVFDSASFGPEVSISSDSRGRVQVGGEDLLAEGAYPSGLKAVANVTGYSNGLFTLKVTVTGDLIDPRETTVTIRAMNK